MELITIEEAAAILGVSADEVKELRERGDIFGLRAGTTWKFKKPDVERYAEDRAAELQAAAEAGGADVDISDESDSGEVVLLSEVELGESSPSTSSTVIGKPGEQSPAESDIKVVTQEERERSAASSSDVHGAPAKGKPDSDVKLVSDGSKPDSDVKLVAGDATEPASDELPLVDEDADTDISFELDEDSGSAEIVTGAHEIEDESGSVELSLGDEMDLDDDFAVADDSQADDDVLAAPAKSRGSGSDVTKNPSDSGISLADPADSGISLADPAESGISLADPADSGLSLDEPFELSDASDEPLELGAAPQLSLADDSDSQEVASLASDDDFLLTPLEEVADDSSDDSGSQVIALDSDTDLGSSDGLLGEEAPLGAMLDEEEAVGAPAGFDEAMLGTATALGGEAVAAAGAPVAAPREAPFTALNVVGLTMCTLMLALGGMMMFDLLRNMWSWEGTYTLNSSLMDLVLGFLPS